MVSFNIMIIKGTQDHASVPSFGSRLLNSSAVHVIVICLLGLIVYSNTLAAPFQWDEDHYLMANPIVKDLNYFLTPAKAAGFEYYSGLKSRYIGYLSFALNYKLHGFDVTGYHILNIFIHILNAVLLYLLVILTFETPRLANSQIKRRSGEIALVTSLLFVAHPLQTEAVTYVFQRFASLVSSFYVISMVMYVKGRLVMLRATEENAKRPYGQTVFCFFLSFVSAIFAMKTKENAFTLPIVMALYEFYFFSGPIKKRMLLLMPLLLTLLIIPLTLTGLDRPLDEIVSEVESATRGAEYISRSGYMFTELRIFVTYLRLLILPVNQNIDYAYPVFHSIFDPPVFLSLALIFFILCFGAYMLYLSKSRAELRIVSFGIFFFFITLSVESSIVPIPKLICEYRVYLPSVGMLLGGVCTAYSFAERSKIKKMHMIVVLLLAFFVVDFATAAYARNMVWVSKISLWADAVKKSPDYADAHNNLGAAYASQDLWERAIAEYQTALRLNPGYAMAHYNLGIAYASQGLVDRVIAEYQTALRLMPDYADAHNNLGTAYASRGQLDRAIAEFQTTLRLNPDYAEAHYNLGIAYTSQGLVDRAIAEFQAALLLNPDYADAHNNLGHAYASQDQLDRAVAEYQRALWLKPDLVEAHYNLGIAYTSQGLVDRAIAEFQTALRLKPDFYEVRQRLNDIVSRRH
jgi:protein O-mannosyl-transferase